MIYDLTLLCIISAWFLDIFYIYYSASFLFVIVAVKPNIALY